MEKYYRSFVTIDLKAVRHNLAESRKKIGDKKLLVVVKTDAYGHGAVALSRAVEDMADYFAVACLSEAVELREGGICKPILILGAQGLGGDGGRKFPEHLSLEFLGRYFDSLLVHAGEYGAPDAETREADGKAHIGQQQRWRCGI